ncbi:enoyl-CoA hydratase/isomerase family protein [Saprospiraceae bacterium]|nr:enoyl-CoA hydratase/isomerase family protein [bacterium]MDC3219556.1 enoyl-CoA hydratase/isomerase family protein [Saprospiraceae bacterium]MDG1434180.1 enoyl-CoA hydratase/isomerase family protein [Saprospiraceae bacterium]
MDYLEIEKKGEYTIIQMNRPKVNAINFQMVKEIREAFKLMEEDITVSGVILTGREGVFSAGLDLIELYDYDKTKIREFFIAFGLMYIELARFSKPFICAITGHSPAGGTVIAITSDYRVMAEGEKYGIGLNEVAVNVQISTNLIEAYSFWLGQSLAYRFVLEGKLLNSEEALKANLVDEVLPIEEVLPQAEKRMKHFLTADKNIWLNTKTKLRSEWLNKLNDQNEEELEEALKIWWSPEVRMKMQMFKAMLAAKKNNSI